MNAEAHCSTDERFCSLFSKRIGEEPIGTAGQYDAYLLLELPLPWQGLWMEPKTAPQEWIDVLKAVWARGVKLRPIAIAPDPEYSQAGHTRVMICQRSHGRWDGYDQVAYLLPTDQVAPFLRAHFQHIGGTAQYERFQQETRQVRDFLVCTHGSVDICCGKFGYPIYQALRDQYGADNLRVWRASHFGGHAFAPTLIEMPGCLWWGHLEPEHLAALVHRTDPVSALRGCYRGWGAVSFFGQIAEREIFMREGWEWAKLLKKETVLEVYGSTTLEEAPRFAANPVLGAKVRIDFQQADGPGAGAYEATLELKGQLMTMHASGAKELRRVNEYRVSRLERVVPRDSGHQETPA